MKKFISKKSLDRVRVSDRYVKISFTNIYEVEEYGILLLPGKLTSAAVNSPPAATKLAAHVGLCSCRDCDGEVRSVRDADRVMGANGEGRGASILSDFKGI